MSENIRLLTVASSPRLSLMAGKKSFWDFSGWFRRCRNCQPVMNHRLGIFFVPECVWRLGGEWCMGGVE